MLPENFNESMMQTMAEQLAKKVLAGIQQSIDLRPIMDDLRKTERLAAFAIFLAAMDSLAVIGMIAAAACGMF